MSDGYHSMPFGSTVGNEFTAGGCMSLGDHCRSGCRTKDHATWGECARAANIATGIDGTLHKNWNRELDSYRSAREQGIQPAGTSLGAVRQALDISDKRGVAFDAGQPIGA